LSFYRFEDSGNSRATGTSYPIFSPLFPPSTPYPPSKLMYSPLSIIPAAQKSNSIPSLDCYRKTVIATGRSWSTTGGPRNTQEENLNENTTKHDLSKGK